MIIWTWWNIYYICSNIPTLTRKNTFMSTYQVDSFFHVFHDTTCDTTQAEESSWHISKHEQHEEPSIHLPLGPRCRCPIFRCLTSFEDWTHFWWTKSKTEHIFGGTSTLNIISDLVLHSCIRSVALHYALLCPFLGCRSFHFQKGDCYESNTNLHEACLHSFFEMTYWHILYTFCCLCQSKVSRLWNTTGSPHN